MQPQSPLIRTATALDANLLAELGGRTFAETFGADNTAEDMDAYLASAFSAEQQARELAAAGSTFLLAEVGSGDSAELASDDWPLAVGYARLVENDAAPSCVAGERPIEIVRLYAVASWIGRGVGAALMRASLEHAAMRDRDTVWLDVWSENPRAIGFYERWGFAVVGEQPFAVGNDVQRDFLMARRLRF